MVEPVLPLHRLGRSRNCVAFVHPRPSYDPHILIVPTIPFAALATTEMGVPAKSALLWEMIGLAREVVAVSPEILWQLTVNGGTRQDIGQVHGHLVHAQDIASPDHHIEVADPSIDLVPWLRLFEDLNAAAERPESGYSLVLDLPERDQVTAWITQSIPA